MIRGKEVCELWCTEPGVFVSEKNRYLLGWRIMIMISQRGHPWILAMGYILYIPYMYINKKQLSYEYWVDDMPFSRGVPAPPLEFYYTLFIVLFSSHPPKTRKDQWIGWIGQIICSQEFSSKMTGEGMTGEGFHSFLWGKMFTHCWLPHYVVDGRYPAN